MYVRRNKSPRPPERHTVPRWDAQHHELSWRGRVIKHFKFEAPDQEAILAAFEALAWQPMVDFAFPVKHGRSAKAKLHDTIQNLNRNVQPWLHFFQEGSGTRIGWRAEK